jgi:hypothetical protein
MGSGGSFPRGKEAEGWSWPLTEVQKGQENVDLYIHSPIGIHSVVLSYVQGQLYLFLPFTYPYMFFCHERVKSEVLNTVDTKITVF